MLSPQEADIVRHLFTRGVDALLEQGWSPEQVNEFLDRPDVEVEARRIVEEYNDRRDRVERVRYDATRRLAKHVTAAVDVIGEALKGPEYERDEKGHLISGKTGPMVSNPEPTTNQLKAAKEVFERIGIGPEVTLSLEITAEMVLGRAKTAVAIARDPQAENEVDEMHSREKARKVISGLESCLPKLLESAAKKLTDCQTEKPEKKRRKRAVKKTTRRAKKKRAQA